MAGWMVSISWALGADAGPARWPAICRRIDFTRTLEPFPVSSILASAMLGQLGKMVTGNEVSARSGLERRRGVLARGNSKPVTTFPVSSILAGSTAGRVSFRVGEGGRSIHKNIAAVAATAAAAPHAAQGTRREKLGDAIASQ
jgi:hypothetical protein